MTVVATAQINVETNTEAITRLKQELADLKAPKEIANLKSQISSLQQPTGAAGTAFLKFSQSMDGLETKLRRVGLDTQDLAVILGAGLAGGVAFAIRSVLRFGAEIVTLAAKISELERVSQGAFGEFANVIEDFADRAVTSLGLARTETLAATNALGISFKNLGIAEQDAAKLSTTLVTVATALSRATAGAKTTAEALDAIRAAVLRQEFDPIENFNIKLKDQEIAQEAVRLGIAKTTKEVDKQAKAIASISLITGDSELALKLLAESESTLFTEGAELGAQFEELKIALGDILLPAVVDFLTTVNSLLGPLAEIAKLIGDLGDQMEKLEKKIPGLGRFATAIVTLGGSEVLRALGALGGGSSTAADEIENLTDDSDLLRASLNATSGEIEVTADKLEQIADARLRLNRAIADSERQVNEAQIRRSRAEEDGNRRVFRALRDRRVAYEQQNRAIIDAEDNLADARLESAQQVRDAEEALTDARRDDRRESVKEADDLKKELQQRTDNILDAQLAIESALFAGNVLQERQARLDLTRAQRKEEINDREKEIEQDRKDRALEISRLERDLDEERVAADERIGEAKEKLAREIEDQNLRIVEAEEKVTDAIRERDEANEDARKNLDNAMREGAERVADAKKQFDRLNASVGDLAEKARLLADQLKRVRDILTDPVFLDPNSPLVKGGGGGFFNPYGFALGNDPYGPGSDSFQPKGTPNPFDPFAPVSSRSSSSTTFNIYETNDPEATAAAVNRRMGRDVNA